MSTHFLYFVMTVFVHHHFTVWGWGRRGKEEAKQMGGRRRGEGEKEGKEEEDYIHMAKVT